MPHSKVLAPSLFVFLKRGGSPSMQACCCWCSVCLDPRNKAHIHSLELSYFIFLFQGMNNLASTPKCFFFLISGRLMFVFPESFKHCKSLLISYGILSYSISSANKTILSSFPSTSASTRWGLLLKTFFFHRNMKSNKCIFI